MTLPPLVISHTRMVLFLPLETTRVPSGENATDLTQPSCPSSLKISAPVAVSQIRTLLSSEPEAIRLPSEEIATDSTPSMCPARICSSGDQDCWKPPKIEGYTPGS